jgi:hypothetical protein
MNGLEREVAIGKNITIRFHKLRKINSSMPPTVAVLSLNSELISARINQTKVTLRSDSIEKNLKGTKNDHERTDFST